MAVIFVIRQRVEAALALVAVAVNVDAGQEHTGPGLQSHPAAYLQRVGLQQDVGAQAVLAEELVLGDPGGAGRLPSAGTGVTVVY